MTQQRLRSPGATGRPADETGRPAETREPDGAVLFTRYAYPPNALGYCGPDDPAALLGATAGGDASLLRELAGRFAGAWPYLQLIAACNEIPDPLDWRVAKAYWIGNSLLDRVPASAFAASLDSRFARRAGPHLAAIARTVPAGGVPHHSFHVFAVYPWLGMLRAGMEGPALTVLDRCRIRSGRVVAVLGDQAVVRCRTLRFDGSRLVVGEEQTELDRVGLDGIGFADGLRAGELVALHWDWVCDRLSEREAERLDRYTNRSLAAVNAQPQPGPAVAAARTG